ncbi:hypothetical protein [Ursidibacter sp. B-7004-1]
MNIELNADMKAKYKEKIEDYARNPDGRIAEAIKSNSVNMLRSIIKLNINDKNISFEKLVIETLYIYEKLPSVFEEFELSKLHKDIETNQSLWNEDYFLTQQSYLTLNFALERIVHLAHVRNEIMKGLNSHSSHISQPSVDHRIANKNKETTANKAFDNLWNNILNGDKRVIVQVGVAIVTIALIALWLLW